MKHFLLFHTKLNGLKNALESNNLVKSRGALLNIDDPRQGEKCIHTKFSFSTKESVQNR